MPSAFLDCVCGVEAEPKAQSSKLGYAGTGGLYIFLKNAPTAKNL